MNRQLIKQRTRGFTLVELLVVVLIITILATIVLFAMFAATETARAARTRSMVARINDLLVPIWESYLTRRVPILITDVDPSLVAGKRLDALRELMRLELPDRKTDVVDDPVTVGLARPALSQAYRRQAIARAGSLADADWTPEHQGAECLYLILSRIQDGDTNGLEFVRETEIGDVDSDGMPEILDGWGTPIRFLRWAPGFIAANGAVTAYQDGTSPDTFDSMGVRGAPPATYLLFPLVMSAGPDKEWDIVFDGATAISYKDTTPKNNPYDSHGLSKKIGAPDDNNNTNGGTPDEHLDNIHNHLQSTGQ